MAGFADDPTAELLLIEPIPPSCLNAKESSPLGFAVLEGRGGGVLLPAGGYCWEEPLAAIPIPIPIPPIGLKPSEMPMAAKS
jgi:hypothetical protein